MFTRLTTILSSLLILGVALQANAGAARGTASPGAGTAPVPGEFKAQSVTWVSLKTGWVLGSAPCGSRTCTYVVGTTDGTKTWQQLGRVNASIATLGQHDRGGLTEIRFATESTGWVIGSKLFRTDDGGASWSPQAIPGDGKQVLDLAANATDAFALVSRCGWVEFCHKPLTFWRQGVAGDGTWKQIHLDLPLAPEFAASHYGADVAVYGKTVYVLESRGQLERNGDRFYASTDGGAHFHPRPIPCRNGPTSGLYSITSVSPTSPKNVAVLCVGNPGMSKSEKFVYRSTNTGRTYTYAGQMDYHGYDSQLAAAPGGNLAVASSSDGSFIYLNSGGEKDWEMRVAYSDGGRGWNDIQYLNDKVAWVIYSPQMYFDGLGKLFVSRDGGHLWHLVSKVTKH